MDKDKEIKLLINTVKALAKINLHYRIGRLDIPEWVFENLDAAKEVYGNDLTIIQPINAVDCSQKDARNH